LTNLDCRFCDMTALDISNNSALLGLNCEYNQLTSLDVSNNTALTSLNCRANQLTTLNVSNNTALHELVCSSNQLIQLNISINDELMLLWIEDMPTLYKVCVWILPFPPPGFQLKVNGSPNAYFTTDCSK